MEKADLEELREKVVCGAVLETAGFAVDLKESTRKAVKYRRGEDIIIVIHDGQGWFDPLSDAKGDVFRLVEHLDGLPFAAALYVVADLVGFVPSEPEWKRQSRERAPDLSVPERWSARRKPWPGSATWRFLQNERALPDTVLRAAVAQDVLREGPQGSMWAIHRDPSGAVTGWEERGPDWRGFATGGAKVLFRLGPVDGPRLCVAEAAIDAMSLAALEEQRPDTRYLSTGGGWSPASSEALLDLAVRADALDDLVAEALGREVQVEPTVAVAVGVRGLLAQARQERCTGLGAVVAFHGFGDALDFGDERLVALAPGLGLDE